MQSMAAGISSLTNEVLGSQPNPDGEKEATPETSAPKGLAQEIRQYIKERQDQEEKLASLHDSIRGLVQQIRGEAAERSPEGKYL